MRRFSYFIFSGLCFLYLEIFVLKLEKKYFKMFLINIILKVLCIWFKKVIISSIDLVLKFILVVWLL